MYFQKSWHTLSERSCLKTTGLYTGCAVQLINMLYVRIFLCHTFVAQYPGCTRRYFVCDPTRGRYDAGKTWTKLPTARAYVWIDFHLQATKITRNTPYTIISRTVSFTYDSRSFRSRAICLVCHPTENQMRTFYSKIDYWNLSKLSFW